LWPAVAALAVQATSSNAPSKAVVRLRRMRVQDPRVIDVSSGMRESSNEDGVRRKIAPGILCRPAQACQTARAPMLPVQAMRHAL
jgi:hypothetical protein